MKRPVDGKVSVIITCYNYGRYLAACIESALSQTYKNLEVIVVNDGSTDNTDDVIKTFVSEHRVKYISQSNQGHARAKNRGIRDAEGEFIAFLDGDDMWVPEKLERQLALFARPEVGVVYSLMDLLSAEGERSPYVIPTKELYPSRGNLSAKLFVDNFIPFSSTVVRRACIEKVGLLDETLQMGNDWDLWLRISPRYEFDYVDEPLMLYRMGHPGQMSKKLGIRQLCSEKIMQKFVDHHPDVLPKSLVRRAWAYTHCNRGYHYRDIDLQRSNEYFRTALQLRPWTLTAYRGLVKNALVWLSTTMRPQPS